VGWTESTGKPVQILIEHWNGHEWSIMHAPRPAGATLTGLADIACPRPISCFAVGWYGVSSPPSQTRTLVEHWNGHRWSVLTSPTPRLMTSLGFTAVACPQPISCFGVGSTATASMVEHWNGHAWSIMKTPPSHKISDLLNGIACPQPRSCFAAGTARDGATNHTFVEHWNGQSWSIMRSRNLVGSRSNTFTAVSCSTPTNCVAVGYSNIGSAQKTLVESWNGRAWSRRTSPNRGDFSLLFGVDCMTQSQCVAVGTVAAHPVIFRGPTFGQIEPIPTPPGSHANSLADVSCTSTATCYAVGATDTRPLIEHGI
jgi:hypothetical protein